MNIKLRLPLSIFTASAYYGVFYSQHRQVHCSDKTAIQKLLAGYKSVDDHVVSNMNIFLGTGSTVQFAAFKIGQKLNFGQLENIHIIPGSLEMKRRCIGLGIPITDLEDANFNIDLIISGCDEIDPNLNMIKGSCGTFSLDKRVLNLSHEMIIICDSSKLTKKLGPGAPLPVEVLKENVYETMKSIELLPSATGCRAILRKGNANNILLDGQDLAISDDGNLIVDLYFEKPIEDVRKLSNDLDTCLGIVTHGLFISNSITPTTVLVASELGVRAAGNRDDTELPWWDELPTRRALKRESIDNAMP